MYGFSLFVYINNILTTAIGCAANVLILILAYRIRDNSTNDVRISIVAHAITDLTLTLVYTALQLGIIICDGTAMLLIIGPITQMAFWISRVLFASFCLLIEVNIVMLPMGFLYRYAVLCRKQWLLKVFSLRCFAIICVALLLILIAFDALLQPFLSFYQNPSITASYQNLGTPILITVKSYGTEVLLGYCSFLCITAVASYVVIIFCAKQTFQMFAILHLSDRTRELQREVTIGMILQAVLPLAFSTLPMIGLVTLILLPIEINRYGTLFFALLYWQPCLHPLLSFYFVRPFREVLRVKFRLNKSAVIALN